MAFFAAMHGKGPSDSEGIFVQIDIVYYDD